MVQSFKAIISTSPSLQQQVKEVRVEDAQNLTFADNSFDASITNFGIFFLPDPVAGARHIYRTLKSGGTAAVSVWKTFGFKPILWEIQSQLKIANPLTELPLMEPWCDGALLERTLKEGGFEQVESSVVKEGLWGKNKEDFKLVLLENLGALTARNWTEERAKLPDLISWVVDEQQDNLCITDGDRVGCMMEAWVGFSGYEVDSCRGEMVAAPSFTNCLLGIWSHGTLRINDGKDTLMILVPITIFSNCGKLFREV
jgi:hypothetical protein